MQYGIISAPFIIVERKDSSTQIYTTYFRFLEEVFAHKTSEEAEISEIMAQNPDLDFI